MSLSSVNKILLWARLSEPFDRATARNLRVPWLVLDLDRTLGTPLSPNNRELRLVEDMTLRASLSDLGPRL